MIGLVDWQFVVGFEGDWSTGYVPNIRDDKGRIRSGTTIISGLDLGHHDEAYIRSLRVSSALTEKLLPFVGMRQTAGSSRAWVWCFKRRERGP